MALRRLSGRRLPPAPRPASLFAALAMLTTLGGLAFGLPALDRSVPGQRPAPPDRAYVIGAGVSVVPPPGAAVDLTRTRPAARRGVLVLLLGPVRYAITVQPSRATLDDAVGRLRNRITGAGRPITAAETAVTTDTGLIGRQGSFTVPGRGGRYAVYLVDGLLIEVTVTGDSAALDRALPTVEASIRTISHRSPR